MFREEKLSQVGQKTNKVLMKNLFTQNTSYGFEYKKTA